MPRKRKIKVIKKEYISCLLKPKKKKKKKRKRKRKKTKELVTCIITTPMPGKHCQKKKKKN